MQCRLGTKCNNGFASERIVKQVYLAYDAQLPGISI